MSMNAYAIVVPLFGLFLAIVAALYTRWEGNQMERKHSQGKSGEDVCPCCGRPN